MLRESQDACGHKSSLPISFIKSAELASLPYVALGELPSSLQLSSSVYASSLGGWIGMLSLSLGIVQEHFFHHTIDISSFRGGGGRVIYH